MKVYVDELPKSCNDCPCFYDESISCQASDKWLSLDEEDNFSRSTQRHPTCPLKSLADYTKQVRKEVLGELMNMLGDRAELIDFGNGCAEFMFTTYDLQECSKELLDQIQGETK